MFILDTNVVSELRKVRGGKADAQVARWAEMVDAASLYLSAITVLELELDVFGLNQRPIQHIVMPWKACHSRLCLLAARKTWMPCLRRA